MQQTKRKKTFQNISFEIKKSEILGIAGVEGNGQKELIESLIEYKKLVKVIFI